MSLVVKEGCEKIRCRKCGIVKSRVRSFRPQRRVCKQCNYANRDFEKERVTMRDWQRRNRGYSRRYNREKARVFFSWVDSLKDKPCADCGKKYPPYVMDWDHVRGKKLATVGELRSRWSMTGNKQVILDEVAKCDLVCSNCHRVRTHARRVARGKENKK